MSEAWLPIETAPRDGTRVLVGRAGYAESMAVAWWTQDFGVWLAVHGVEFPDVTHWQPLPEPPEGY